MMHTHICSSGALKSVVLSILSAAVLDCEPSPAHQMRTVASLRDDPVFSAEVRAARLIVFAHEIRAPARDEAAILAVCSVLLLVLHCLDYMRTTHVDCSFTKSMLWGTGPRLWIFPLSCRLGLDLLYPRAYVCGQNLLAVPL